MSHPDEEDGFSIQIPVQYSLMLLCIHWIKGPGSEEYGIQYSSGFIVNIFYSKYPRLDVTGDQLYYNKCISY